MNLNAFGPTCRAARLPEDLKVGVAQNEDSIPDLACTDFRRRDDARSNPVAHVLKVPGDVLEAKGEMSGHVLEEHPFGSDLGDDAGDVGPEVAGIVLALPQSGEGEGLAWITGSDEMNAAAPRSAVEGLEIVPDRSWRQGRVRHPCHEHGRGKTVSLDKAHSSETRFCDVQAEVEPADAGTEAEASEFMNSFGMCNHTMSLPFRRFWCALVKGLVRLGWASRWSLPGSAGT